MDTWYDPNACTKNKEAVGSPSLFTLSEFTKLKTTIDLQSYTCKIDLKFAFESIKIEGMSKFMIFMWVLCVGEFVHCKDNHEPEYIGYDSGVGKNKLNFGYGVNFKYNGLVHNNLDRVWIVQRFNLPKELNENIEGRKFGLNCTFIEYADYFKSHLGHMASLNIIKDICQQTQPLLKSISQGAIQYQQILKRLIKDDLYNALHSFSAVEHLIFKRHVKRESNSSESLQADIQLEEEDLLNSENTDVGKRDKRGVLAFLPLIGKIATIAVEALGSHLQKKRQRAMIKAVNHLQSKQFLTRNQLYTMEKEFLMYGEYDVQSTDGLIKVLKNLNNRTVFLEKMLTGQSHTVMKKYVTEGRGIQIYAHQINLYVQAMRERYLRTPENLIAEMRLLLRSIAILSKGYLPPQLFSPTDLVKISLSALSMVQKRHPDYVLAIPQASSYYDMRLVTFGIDNENKLVVCFPIFVKDFSREAFTLYQIETVPVPIVDTNLKANSYSQALVNKPYIATNADYYIQLVMEELFMCKQIKQIYFCEEIFLVKHKTKHSCESALFYNLSSTLIKQNCEFKYMFNTTVIPSVLDGGSQIVLANMLPDKRLICTYDQGLAKPLPSSPYVLVDRKILCHCHIQSGLTYVLKNVGACNSTLQPTISYTVNLAFLTFFSSFLNNTQDISTEPMSIEQTLPIAMEDFSQDPDFQIYCQDINSFPETLAQLAHVHLQKKLFLSNKNEFLSEGKAGMNEEVLDTPISNRNSFSFLFTIAFHIFVFLGSALSMIMLLPQVYMIIKQKKLRGLVAAIALFKQATEATAGPVQQDTQQTTKVICHDPWVSFILTLLTVLGMIAYMYKHGRQLSIIYGHKFTNLCEVYVLACTKTHFVKIKVATLGGSPSLFKMKNGLKIDKVSLQKGYIWDILHIDWEGINLTHGSQEVHVREHVSIPLIDRIRMRRVFHQAEEFNIMVQQGDTWLTVPEENS